MLGRMIQALGGIATCAFALSIALPSFAANTSEGADLDLYVEYSVGASFVPNQNLKGADASGAGLAGNVEPTTGFLVGGAIGKRFHEYFRAELQLSYRESEVNNMSLRGEPDDATGDISLLAVMANGYVDYDLGVGVVPYLGVGIGWGSVDVTVKNRAGALTARVDGEDSVFVWSLMVGGSYPINEILDLSLGYRYIATTDPDLNSNIKDLGARRLEGEFDAHEVILGLRFNF